MSFVKGDEGLVGDFMVVFHPFSYWIFSSKIFSSVHEFYTAA